MPRKQKNAAAEDCRGVREAENSYAELFDEVNGFLDVFVRPVDVLKGMLL